MATPSTTLAPGEVVAGRYRIDALVGEGGFGIVFRATQLPIGRTVALKMLLAGALAHAEGRARFRREAEMAQRLEHPNTVRLYDFGETDDGLPFIAWELLKGRPLDALLAAEGPLAPARVARIAAQTLKALMEAHDLGIVHRDIKPSNVFLCEFPGEHDFVKVLDFGIAKNTLTHGTGLTPHGSTVGTPAYMAPEQAKGGEITPVTDLYALGLVMSEMLSGRRVYPSASPLEAMMAQLSDAPPPIPQSVLGSPFGPVIARAAAKTPAARFASAAEMLAAVEAAVAPGTSAGPGGPAARSAPSSLVVPSGGTATAAALATAPTAQVSTFDPGDMPSPPAVEPAIDPARGPVVAPPPPARVQPASVPVLAPAPAPHPIAPPIPGPPLPSPVGAARILLAASAGLVVIAAAILAVVVTRLHDRPRADPTRAPGPATVQPGTKRFAHLTNKQIRDRIERAGYRIVNPEDREPISTWMLSTTSIQFVTVARAGDLKSGELTEHAYDNQGGVTARDGTVVIHVQLARPEALRLLDQITR